MKNAKITLRSSWPSNAPTRSAESSAPSRPSSSHGSRCRKRRPIDSTAGVAGGLDVVGEARQPRQILVVLGGQHPEDFCWRNQANEVARLVDHGNGVAAAVDSTLDRHLPVDGRGYHDRVLVDQRGGSDVPGCREQVFRADQANKPVVVADRHRRRGRESPARERRNHVRS